MIRNCFFFFCCFLFRFLNYSSISSNFFSLPYLCFFLIILFIPYQIFLNIQILISLLYVRYIHSIFPIFRHYSTNFSLGLVFFCSFAVQFRFLHLVLSCTFPICGNKDLSDFLTTSLFLPFIRS